MPLLQITELPRSKPHFKIPEMLERLASHMSPLGSLCVHIFFCCDDWVLNVLEGGVFEAWQLIVTPWMH